MSRFVGGDGEGNIKRSINRFALNTQRYEFDREMDGTWDINSHAELHSSDADKWPRPHRTIYGRTGSGSYNETTNKSFTQSFTVLNGADADGNIYGGFDSINSSTPTSTYGVDYYITVGGVTNTFANIEPSDNTTSFRPIVAGTSTGNAIAAGDDYDKNTITIGIEIAEDYTVDSNDPETIALATFWLHSLDDKYDTTQFNAAWRTSTSNGPPPAISGFSEKFRVYYGPFTSNISDTSQQSTSGSVSLQYYESRYGSNIGTWNWYWVDTNGQNPTLLGGASGQTTASWVSATIATNAVTTPNVGHLVCVYLTGSSFRGDLAFDDLVINGTTYSTSSSWFNWSTWNDTGGTGGGGSAGIPTAFANDVSCTISSSASLGWCIRQGSTGSSSTGPTGARSNTYYIYAETSSPSYPNKYMYLISPQLST